MRLFFICVSILFLVRVSGAQDVSRFSAAAIADSLKKDAHSVLRLDEATLEVVSPSKYIFRVHQVITVLNQEGSGHFRHVLHFDKFRTVGDVTIKMYNSLGLLVKKYSKKDFEIEAAYDGISLATDDKLMRLTTPPPGYPCTIEVEYEYRATGYIELPDWYLNTNRTGVEIFRYTVAVPHDLDIRYRSYQLNLEPVVQTTEKKKIYTWEAQNIKPGKISSTGFEEGQAPRIAIAPNTFEYDGYGGRFSSWAEFGKWNLALYQERNPFNEQRQKEIRNLADGVQNESEKVAVLYNYLQKSMRYVSIQFGIGGFKPFAVKFVDDRKYGDCKALTNYMRYMLEVAGIRSYPALVNAGRQLPPVDPDFPSSMFNHVILCVPLKTDTMWLECTSNSNYPGFLGTFTENKNALLLTENGGVMVRTPSSKPTNNLKTSHTDIFLDEHGGATAVSRLYRTGDALDLFQEIKKETAGDQKEIVYNYLQYKPAEHFDFAFIKDSLAGQVYRMHFNYERFYAFKAGNKFFYPAAIGKLFTKSLKDEARTEDYLFDYPFIQSDTVIFHLPKGYAVDEVPPGKELSHPIASYQKKVLSEPGGPIRIITTLELKQRLVPAAQYRQLARFFASIEEQEAHNLILRKL